MAQIFARSPFAAGAAKRLAVVLALALVPLPAAATVHPPPPAATANPVAESYKLPVSRPRDQGDSDLCWVYATLNMLETNYLSKHPRSTIDLSRGALQRRSIEDRFQRQITGDSSHLEDGGIAVDALQLIRESGLVDDHDFHDIVDSDPIFRSLASQLARRDSGQDRLKALEPALDRALGATPRQTHLDGKALSPRQFAEIVLGDDVWTEFDVIHQGAAHVGPSDDPDARPGTQVHYVYLPAVIELIHQSLVRGQAVVWGRTDNHALLIYGADYDANGRPLAYWIKDSFAPYAYRAPADDIHKVLTDVTVATPPRQEARTEAGK
jgi:hypothetical protein